MASAERGEAVRDGSSEGGWEREELAERVAYIETGFSFVHTSSGLSAICTKEKTRISSHCVHLKLSESFTGILINTICILTYSPFLHYINYALFLSTCINIKLIRRYMYL